LVCSFPGGLSGTFTEGRFASQRRDKAGRLKQEDEDERTAATISGRTQKAEMLDDEIAAKLRKVQDLKRQGNV
jgi:hypothetical protein